MATYTVADGDIGVQGKTLAKNTVDTITFSSDLDAAVVFSDGVAALYFTVDGSTPTVGGANTHMLPKGVRAVRQVIVPSTGNTVVKLISVGAVTYSVEEGHEDDAPSSGLEERLPAELSNDRLKAEISPADDSTFETADKSPPFVPIGPGGLTVAPGDEVELVPAVLGRIKISVNHFGLTGNLWLGFGQTASGDVTDEEVGEWLEPGGRWEEFYAGAVRVRNTGSDPIRVTFMEWGT